MPPETEDLWVVHPKLARDGAPNCDRVTLAALAEAGLLSNPDTATTAQIRAACETWWGEYLDPGDLATAVIEVSQLRVRLQGMTRERVLRAPTITRAQATDSIDPRRTRR